MRAEHVNELMGVAASRTPGPCGALTLAVGAARLAERWGIPLGVVVQTVVLAYEVSARRPCAPVGARR